MFVATALTVYGIETVYPRITHERIHLLQQHLPFTVLKLIEDKIYRFKEDTELQQHLPFTVLKLGNRTLLDYTTMCCNSTYRLRY